MSVHRFVPGQVYVYVYVFVCFGGKDVTFVKVPLSICKSLPPDRHLHMRDLVSSCVAGCRWSL